MKNHKGQYNSLDELSMMYKDYDLNKKIYEIPTNTSEIRTEKTEKYQRKYRERLL